MEFVKISTKPLPTKKLAVFSLITSLALATSTAGLMVMVVGISILSSPSIRKISSTKSAGILMSGLL